jgi:glutamyl-tRNA synthetase
MVVGRFAPSPSGDMHLGNARTALLAWLDVRARGGRMLLRIEDLDRERCNPALAGGIRRDLAWLGLDWDAETAAQSTRDPAYRSALADLDAAGSVYECFCSRRELAVASAPHGPDSERRYLGTCRALDAAARAEKIAAGRSPAARVRMPDDPVRIVDRVHGPVEQRVAEAVGDIVVRRSDGLFAYQLAVVVDDAADGVTDVVRADDLLWSTPRQVALQHMLGLPTPAYAHVPLVLGPDGARLAKRHGAVTLAELRAAGVGAAEIVGRLAASAGLVEPGSRALPGELVAGFRIDRIDRCPVRLPEGAGIGESTHP